MAGKNTGDKELLAEGKLDKTKGEAHNAVSEMKDAFATRPNTRYFGNSKRSPGRTASSLSSKHCG
jgi:hypothetical protein